MRVFVLLYCATLFTALCVYLAATRPAPEAKPAYDFERMTFCLIDHGFPYGTISESNRAVRFCLKFDQEVAR